MIVSPLQQLAPVDAPLNGLAQPLAVGSSPMGDGAFSAWLAATTAPVTGAPKTMMAQAPLPGDIPAGSISNESATDDGIIAPLNSMGAAPLTQTVGDPVTTVKPDVILNAPKQAAVKAGFLPILEGNVAPTKELSVSTLAENQFVKSGSAPAMPGGTTSTSSTMPATKVPELISANLAHSLSGQMVAQNGNNARQSAPNASSFAQTSTSHGIDTFGQISEPVVQSNLAHNSNTNSAMPVANAGIRENTTGTGNANQTTRGSLNTTINTADIAVQMAKHKADGSNQFTIRLSPHSMGTVTIQLTVGDNAQLSAQMQVEKPETLALLQKDMAGLEKALKNQGFNTSSSDISIALKSATTGIRMGEVMGESLGDQRPGQGQNQSSTQAGQSNSTSNNQSVGTQNVGNHPAQSGALDRNAAGNALPSGDTGGFHQSSQGRGDQSQMASDQGFQGHPDSVDVDDLGADDLDPDVQEFMNTITSAYQAGNFQVGMSSQIDLSI